MKTSQTPQKQASLKSQAMYLKSATRVAEIATKRASLLGREPVLMDLATTLIYRHLAVKMTTFRTEVMGIRQVVSSSLNDDPYLWEELAQRFDWVDDASEKDIQDLSREVFRQPGEFVERWKNVPEDEYSAYLESGTSWSKEEFCEHLARISTRKTNRPPKEQKMISWSDYRALEVELSDEDPQDVLWDLINKKAVSSAGLLRIFITATFLTGMRPIEVWNCALHVPNMNLVFTDGMRTLINTDPSLAIQQGLLVPADIYMKDTPLSAREVIMNAVSQADAPCAMFVHSAKQTNANPEIRQPYRILVLDNVPEAALGLLFTASIFRKIDISIERRDNFRSSMARRIRTTCDKIPQLRSREVSLYSFRHSFATRVRRFYSPPEAAAMTGHTGRRTFYAYGERYAQRSRQHPQKHNWLPRPDPRFAKTIDYAWNHRGPEPGPLPVLKIK